MLTKAEDVTFRGEPAIEIGAGDLKAVFLPHLGLTGVSLRYRGREHLALPGGLAALRARATTGLPLLAPWANRLASRRYRAAGQRVDLSRRRLSTDANGLPIHGLLVGRGGWRVERLTARRGTATLGASIDVDEHAFPFPHRIDVTATAHPERLVVDTTVTPTGRRRVPVAFGWHPYLRLPGTPRSRWRLRLPRRRHLTLDDAGIPTGTTVHEAAESAAIGRRTLDDLYALGRDRSLAFEADDGSAIELRCSSGYGYAQVWVPRGRNFASLEPMSAPTNALADDTALIVRPGESYSARFELRLWAPSARP